MTLSKCTLAGCVAVGFFLSGPSLQAQKVESAVRGLVLDASEAAIREATVTAVHSATGVSRSALTNRQGYYVLPSLPAGVYEISAAADGFRKLRQTELTLTVGEHAAVDFLLQVGEVTACPHQRTAS